ncbi:MAG: hypothetical protein ACI8QC_004433 [Planctomycetota bacterium]|jgi:hypothetical protein
MTFIQYFARSFALVGAGLLTLGASAQAAAPQDSTAPRYVRAKQGAQVRNFQDMQGLAFHSLKSEDLMKVHNQSRGKVTFLEVSTPGGFPVWVFGKYLQETGAQGVLRVSGSHVNMRPRPDSSAASMPLRERLMTGDTVAFISRRDPVLPMAQDWVRVWSPESARAWVRAEDVIAADGAGLVTEYRGAMRQLASAPKNKPAVAKPTHKATPRASVAKVPDAVIDALAKADSMLEDATRSGLPTAAQLGAVESAYRKVLADAPARSHTHALAAQQMERVSVLRGLADVRAELAADKIANAKRLDKLAVKQSQAELKSTVSWGRFHARGWLEREEPTRGEVHYYVRWDGMRQAELICGQGRYNLEAYVGFQLGIQGHTRRPAQAASLGGPAMAQVIDVYKVEVIAGSAGQR